MKILKGSWITRMGQNFDDYPDFQPKITHPKYFSRQCMYSTRKCICTHKATSVCLPSDRARNHDESVI